MNNNTGNIGDRVAVVSGGSRGLGLSIVQHLLQKGWSLETFSRKFSSELGKTTSEYPGLLNWRSIDAELESDLKAYCEYLTTLDHIDLLINNVATLNPSLFLSTPYSVILRSTWVNYFTPMLLTSTCVKKMLKRGGKIINISSINAIRGYKGVAIYSAAKAGIDAMNKPLAVELGPLRISINSIISGYFDSDMSSVITDKNRNKILNRTPLGRFGTKSDIIPALDFLIDDFSFITGQTIIIDGGITC
jgi:3-oxoacyl-[acyl-carrier protein] reductase